MRFISIADACADLVAVLDSAIEDLEEVVITRIGHEPAVVISLREYESLKETLYLLGNPANAQHLARSIASLRRGNKASVTSPVRTKNSRSW
ncbi:type II toxin-antitoxin system Phd/YefM family antitoxin [Nocardia sp. NPDC051321]|uniref:type II toxin-antitoxin system Phd/YefM family antitoxin n=1 Tax=Nocardia sp. NPDC051321 TaxID=3364323 RepID=UPI0037A9BCE5